MKTLNLTLSILFYVLFAISNNLNAQDGAALYQQNCAQCHGSDLNGGNATSLVDGIWQFGEENGYQFRNIKFGIALKNIGPTMKFTGDGMSFRGIVPAHNNDNDQFTVEQRSADFELPALLNIGAAYDFNINENHTLTIAGNFTSNSFTKDQYILGAEYKLKTYLMLRGAYTFEEDITNDDDRTTVFTGPSAGLTVQIPLNKEKGTNFSLDYSFRATNPFDGTHSIGARITL
jgi:hypothetical protein